MKTSTLPTICGVTLASMIAAGTSHWWTVRQTMVAMNGQFPAQHSIQRPASPRTTPQPATLANAADHRPASTPPAAIPAAESHQKDFYEALISKMASVETQNRDLLDQLAETNRDLMKLEFRVDTHSESFRPLPVGEDQPFSSLDDEGLGVLPPRAEPVLLPTRE